MFLSTLALTLALVQQPPLIQGPVSTNIIPTCAFTYLLGEAIVSPQTHIWLAIFNPLTVSQLVEVRLYDSGSSSPSFHILIEGEQRWSFELFEIRRLYATPTGVSVEVRFEYGGHASLSTWPLDYGPASQVYSPAQLVTLCR